MLQPIIAGLVLALISGLTFLAYKHPLAFRPLVLPLWIILIASIYAITIWNAGLLWGRDRLLGFISEKDTAQAKTVIEQYYVPTKYVLLLFGSFLYLWFLKNVLPELMEREKEKDRP